MSTWTKRKRKFKGLILVKNEVTETPEGYHIKRRMEISAKDFRYNMKQQGSDKWVMSTGDGV